MNIDLARSTGSTSSGLLLRAKAQQPDAWEELAQTYAPLVYHWCRQSRLNPADAADVTQEVFRSVVQGIANLDVTSGAGSFRGWLRVITRNRLIDHARRQKHTEPAAGGTANQLQLDQVADPAALLPDEPPSIGNELAQVHQALETLRAETAPQTWQAFWRLVVEGHSPTDVARDLKMKIGAVYQARWRTLARLRRLLDPDAFPPERKPLS